MKAIASMSLNRVIGKEGKLLFHCSSDLKWFKQFTMDQDIIVGRKTWEKLPKLPGRTIWILSKTLKKEDMPADFDGFLVDSVDYLPPNGIVAGGGEIYKELLPLCDEVYLTIIKQVLDGDVLLYPFEKDFKSPECIFEDEERMLLKFVKP